MRSFSKAVFPSLPRPLVRQLNGKQHGLGRDKSDVVTAKGRELAAWQGSKEPQFRSALDLLSRSTKAELRAV
jgi:hypothetical protein